MEQTVAKEFEKLDATLSEEELVSRIDIKYRTTYGKHLIIEVKRANRVVCTTELMEQCDKYSRALRKLLDAAESKDEAIEVVCDVSRPLSDWENNPTYRQKSIESLEKMGIRVALYQELVESTMRSYQVVINKKQEVGRIYDLIQQIDVDVKNTSDGDANA